MFHTIKGREHFRNHCVAIWRCPTCGGWRPAAEEHCVVDGTPRDAEVEPKPEMLTDQEKAA